MNHNNKWIGCALFILWALIRPMTIQAAGVLTGQITDQKTGETLPGANVQVLGTILGAGADENGKYRIDNLPPGWYDIRVSMISYRTHTEKKVVIREGETTTFDVELRETVIEFDPIVVLGGKTKQRLDQANVSLSVVTSREIESRNATNIIEALETAPGINFIGNQINIRGSNGYTFGAGNKVLLLVDDVPVYTSDTGEFNWDMLPPMDIEQIEILKGAGSTLWGSAALGGVVNVITKNPSPQGKLLFGITAGKYGRPAYDEWLWTDPDRLHYTREDISYSKRFGRLGMRVSAGRFFSTGYTQVGDFRKYNLTGKVDYQFKNGIKWTGYAALSHVKRGFFFQWKGQNDPYEVDETNLNNYADVDQLNLYTKLAVPFSARFAFKVRLSLIRSLTGDQFGKGDQFNPAYGQGVELQSDWIPVFGHTLTAGIQYQYDTGSTKYFGDHRGYLIGPYIQDEWKIRGNLRATTGLRYDRYQLIGGAKEDLFSPRFGINWQPWEKTSIRASAGSGFRAATIVERFMELTVMNFKIIKNEDLRAESSWAFDIGFRQYITEDWNLDVSLFNNEYWDLIEAHMDLIRGQIQFRNIPRARIRGIEATSKWGIPVTLLGMDVVPGLQVSITAMDHEDLKWHEPLTYRPKVLFNIRFSLDVENVNIQADYRYASKIDAVKIYPINERVPMKFVDIRVSLELWKIKAQVGIQNLLNYNYAPMESNLMPMRTYIMGIQGEF